MITENYKNRLKELAGIINENIQQEVEHLRDTITDILNVSTDLYYYKYPDGGSALRLALIKVSKDNQNQGLGSKAMKMIVDFADKNGMKIFLTPTSEWGSSKIRLNNFYKSFGFVPNSGKNKDWNFKDSMVRLPIENNKEVLSEGLSNIVYHFTGVHSVINILETNEINVSTNIGSNADLHGNKARFFFFSTTRSKSGGYKSGSVKLVLNGNKLNQRYKGFPVDYWQWSKKPSDWGDVENDENARKSYIQALQSNEMEDRIALDKPFIENALQYILEIHVKTKDKPNYQSRLQKSVADELISLCKEKNIPLFFYNNEKDFLIQKNNIDPATIDYEDESEPYEPSNRPIYLFRVFSILSHNDEDNYNKIIKGLNKEDDEHFQSELKEQIKKDNYYYYSYPDKFNNSELNAVISSEIHNNRSKPNPEIRFAFLMLMSDMKKLSAKNLSEYIAIKTNFIKR